MTQKEIDLQMQELRLQYTKKSNEIGRMKDDVSRRKNEAMLAADDAFHEQKRERVAKINRINAEKAALFEGDPKKDVLQAEVRTLESEINIMRSENDNRKRTITNNAYAERRELDEKSRQLSEWYEGEKLKVLRDYMSENQ